MIGQLKLRVVEYFGSLVNQIDLKAETLLIEDFSKSDLISHKRNLFIEEIKRVEAVNII